MEKEEKSHDNNQQSQTNSSITESHLAKLVTVFLIQEINRSLVLIKISEFIF